MTHNEVKFYSKFPFIDTTDLDPYAGKSFNDAIVSKKEFAMEKLDRIEPFPENPGEYLHHQKYIARYMSVYDELLLFHEPGTGKTCTAVAAIEALKYAEDRTIKRAIICSKGMGINKNFLQELIFTCSDGSYIPEDYDQLTEIQQTIRTRKAVSEFYAWKTFEVFAKDLSMTKDSTIVDMFEDTIFILDEVHNLREHDVVEPDEDDIFHKKPINIYDQFHRLFHLLKRRKIILMSGTPIKDTPDEFASLMNLLLPIDKQLNVKTFIRDYFNKDQTALVNQSQLANIIKGRVSYLNAATTNVEKRYIGRQLGNLKYFVVSESIMSDFQTDAYTKAYQADDTIFINSRQASLLVYPDGSYGSTGYNKYVKNTKERLKFLNGIKTVQQLRKYSAKYAQIVEILLSQPMSKHFIYCQYVHGSGAVILGKILENFGFSQANGIDKKKKLRYALCTRYESTSKQIQQIVNRFNADDNIDGEYISVIIGSRVLNEGFTLKNVRNEFILTGHWNYAEVAQAIARGWRLGSHNAMLNRGDVDVHVDVYQCVSIPSDTSIPSIDIELYETAEKKDVINRLIERLVKVNAVDCALTIDRNKVMGYDGQRECDYQACDYTCEGVIGDPLDISTYGLFRDIQEKTKQDVIDRITDVVSYRDFTLSIESLVVDFTGRYSEDEIVNAITSIIGESTLFNDAFGFPHFLGIKNNNKLFLTINPGSTHEFLDEYYSKNRVLERSSTPSFGNIVNELYDEALPAIVTQVFTHKKVSRNLLVSLPYRVQSIILRGCLLSKILGKTRNIDVRDDILDFYRGFYDTKQGKLTVWLYAEEIGSMCYDEDANEFIPCALGTHRQMVSLKTSPIEWYGLVNPSTQDFCIRNVGERDVKRKDTPGVDLRRVTVGKRCINYDKKKLSEIADKMHIGSRSDMMLMSKVDLCSNMKNWFEANNLLERNFDCGTAKKSRGKFAA